MNQSFFEGRFLINMVAGVIRQDELFPVHRQMNWERLYRLSDYHHIANIIYLGMLGGADKVPPVWKDHFFKRYQQALHYNDIFIPAEKAVLNVFNKRMIPALILESSAIRNYYSIPETADNSPLRLYFDDEEAFVVAKRILIQGGYLTDQYYPTFGERLTGQKSGFQVEIYYHLPFMTRNYEKNFRQLVKKTYPDPEFQNLQIFSAENRMVFRLAEMAYRYCNDSLLMRGMLDVLSAYQRMAGKIDEEYVTKALERFAVDELAKALLQISSFWFGTRKDPIRENLVAGQDDYEEIENRILSNGLMGKDRLKQALDLRQQIQKAGEVEDREEKNRRTIGKLWGNISRVFTREPSYDAHLHDIKGGNEIKTTGDVSYTLGNQGAVIHTPFFLMTVPEFWLGRCSITCSSAKDDIEGPPKDRRSSAAYALFFNFVDSKYGKELPLLKITLYRDVEYAAELVTSGGEYYNQTADAYYMGRLVHRQGGKKQTLHVVAEKFVQEDISGKDAGIYSNMMNSLNDVLNSITARNDYGDTSQMNEFKPFADWLLGDMPREYYYGMSDSDGRSSRKSGSGANAYHRSRVRTGIGDGRNPSYRVESASRPERDEREEGFGDTRPLYRRRTGDGGVVRSHERLEFEPLPEYDNYRRTYAEPEEETESALSKQKKLKKDSDLSKALFIEAERKKKWNRETREAEAQGQDPEETVQQETRRMPKAEELDRRASSGTMDGSGAGSAVSENGSGAERDQRTGGNADGVRSAAQSEEDRLLAAARKNAADGGADSRFVPLQDEDADEEPRPARPTWVTGDEAARERRKSRSTGERLFVPGNAGASYGAARHRFAAQSASENAEQNQRAGNEAGYNARSAGASQGGSNRSGYGQGGMGTSQSGRPVRNSARAAAVAAAGGRSMAAPEEKNTQDRVRRPSWSTGTRVPDREENADEEQNGMGTRNGSDVSSVRNVYTAPSGGSRVRRFVPNPDEGGQRPVSVRRFRPKDLDGNEWSDEDPRIIPKDAEKPAMSWTTGNREVTPEERRRNAQMRESGTAESEESDET